MKSIDIEKKLDTITEKITERLCEEGFINSAYYDREGYYRKKELIKNFYIPKTSITKLASRILYSIGLNSASHTIVGAGTYTGHAISWLISESDAKFVYALDIDPAATRIAVDNFSNFKPKPNCINIDAESWLCQYDGSIDILYIDVDTIDDGKKKYVDILEAAYEKISANGIIIAHDINEEKFQEDMVAYKKVIANRGKFKNSINLNIDDFGLAITKKK
ncbi:class I SAM-dependent methyltransferase [Shouchella tritolerans]|uniref:class I SAM-dependent methyltransferase n=1 Tax=Shouchella tritolerans TaxID=2979466 RepID=UPI0021E782E5|nr:class I SAM-dependent methyltransferase [Shouchella tritolerans]